MTIKRVGVVGSGTMGLGIAEVAAASGCEVVVRSRSTATAEGLVALLEKSLARQVEKEKRTKEDADEILARVTPTGELEDLAECDLIIESIVEDLAVKKQLFMELDRLTRRDAILATNTSTLPVVELAMETSRPELVCGVHFFNPAPVMRLVEVVVPITASEETIAAVHDFVGACGKEAVEVKDRAGFVVNALLFPFLNNAMRLLEAQVATMEGIDAAMTGGCGFPMGPFALLDLVGLDTSLLILEALHREGGDPSSLPSPMLRRLVAAGRLGRKSGHGFYDYRR
ncbi:MAG TPA: 3-hydroxyacyl-CoA dehydrogenase family protein [Acidimicrobiales bacterium]|nr:3-hydroxyacyl-CoA dehydrogenase family protein [Acidimicrobiales bacterium]